MDSELRPLVGWDRCRNFHAKRMDLWGVKSVFFLLIQTLSFTFEKWNITALFKKSERNHGQEGFPFESFYFMFYLHEATTTGEVCGLPCVKPTCHSRAVWPDFTHLVRKESTKCVVDKNALHFQQVRGDHFVNREGGKKKKEGGEKKRLCPLSFGFINGAA